MNLSRDPIELESRNQENIFSPENFSSMIEGIYQRIFSGCCVKPISLSTFYKELRTKQLNSYLPILLFLIFSDNFFFCDNVRSAEKEYIHKYGIENK